MVEKLKSYLPYFVAVAAFIVISFVYFAPTLEGKHLPQMDDTHAKALAQELNQFEKETGEKAQ